MKCRLKGDEGPSLHLRSGLGSADSAIASLTDSHYLDDLQNALQEAYTTSLHNRLEERKVNIALPKGQITLNSTGGGGYSTLHPSVRQKVQQKPSKKTKSTKTGCNGNSATALCSTENIDGPQGSIEQCLDVNASLPGYSPKMDDKLRQTARTSVRFFNHVQVLNCINRIRIKFFEIALLDS